MWQEAEPQHCGAIGSHTPWLVKHRIRFWENRVALKPHRSSEDSWQRRLFPCIAEGPCRKPPLRRLFVDVKKVSELLPFASGLVQ